jgi:hypothetical protein
MYIDMSPPILSTVKERVIQLHLEGKGRNEIAEILNSSHTRISQGSVTNILNAWKLEHGNSEPSQPHPETRPQEVSPTPPSPDDSTSPGQSQEHVPLSIENAKVQEHIPVPEGAKASDQDHEESFMDLGWSMVFEEVREAKKQRHDELLLIERKKRELEERKRQIDQSKYDLKLGKPDA